MTGISPIGGGFDYGALHSASNVAKTANVNTSNASSQILDEDLIPGVSEMKAANTMIDFTMKMSKDILEVAEAQMENFTIGIEQMNK
ncbi:hypothetical protein SAMN05216249_12112 [Acetitomaculum ruminis DSM 5522]|uniref:Uncharacterized protein n=1 Tax=Acetitomaculum ruminis DSM 5522 TaxID=1120918 RepID=A0A1I1A3Y0_9FIRM|nr:hypothetical protein [Acetitomaculum ruminis]SFB32669.1 hypothetical protein SAMN05216249_12112 [Acetitomaculum ruminis DSM 5522]